MDRGFTTYMGEASLVGPRTVRVGATYLSDTLDAVLRSPTDE